MDWRRDFLRFASVPRRGEVFTGSPYEVEFSELQRRITATSDTREWVTARLGAGRVRRLHTSSGPRGKFSVWMSRRTQARGVPGAACVWLVEELTPGSALILAYVLPLKTEHATWIRQFTQEAIFRATPDAREQLLLDGRDLVKRLMEGLSGGSREAAANWLRKLNTLPDLQR